MTDNKLDDEIKATEPETTPEPKSEAPKSADSKTDAGGTPKGYVTEESYQGLQRVVAKKDKELESLKEQVATLSTQFEELKADSTKLTGTKGTLEAQLQEAQNKLSELETSRNSLDKQLQQQGIIMQEFPNLARLAQYIPAADNADQYRENAKSFAEAMDAFVQTGVQSVISGGSPPQPRSDDTVGETEEDKLWNDVYSLAGVPGKEREYAEANRRLQEVLAAKKK